MTKGASVRATVTGERHRRIGRPGWVQIQFQSITDEAGNITLLDNTPIRVEGKKRLTGAIVGTVFLGPLFLLFRGGDVTLQAGSTLEAIVAQ